MKETGMNYKPTVTYAGDPQVFLAIEPGLLGGLPTESVEWKRWLSYSSCFKIFAYNVFLKDFYIPGNECKWSSIKTKVKIPFTRV